MLRKLVATLLVLAMPAAASAGPLREAVEKAGRELAAAQATDTRDRGRFWSGIALIAGGGVLTALGSLEIGDDEPGPDDGEDFDDSDDGEDADGVNKALIAGGIGAAAVGSFLLLKGRKKTGPVVSLTPGRVAIKQTLRF